MGLVQQHIVNRNSSTGSAANGSGRQQPAAGAEPRRQRRAVLLGGGGAALAAAVAAASLVFAPRPAAARIATEQLMYEQQRQKQLAFSMNAGFDPSAIPAGARATDSGTEL